MMQELPEINMISKKAKDSSVITETRDNLQRFTTTCNNL